jgi:DNA-binding GntR family transcriptional regulator
MPVSRRIDDLHRPAAPAAFEAYRRLKDAILSARLPPGAPLSDHQFAEELGTSRTPVREAILRLQMEGLVRVVPQVGTFVSRLDLGAIRDALFVRECVECGALEALADAGGPAPSRDALAPVAEAAAAHRRAVAADDLDAAMAADERFHRALLELAGRGGVWPVVRQAREAGRRVRALSVPRLAGGRRSAEQHGAILAALEAGRPADAAARLRAHIRMNVEFAATLAREWPDSFEPESRA